MSLPRRVTIRIPSVNTLAVLSGAGHIGSTHEIFTLIILGGHSPNLEIKMPCMVLLTTTVLLYLI